MNKRFPVFIETFRPLLETRRIVKVTGTNGKGSLCAMLESSLLYEGLRVGLFTSPHLSRITERFRVGGLEIAPELLDRYAEKVLRIARETVETDGEAWRPSFFEALIAIAISFFDDEEVDVMIFEAGIGGYNDAVGLLPGEFSVITSIGMDHQEQLGNSLEAVAADKAGIASPGSWLILGADISTALAEIIEANARERNVTVCRASMNGVRATSIELRRPMRIEMIFGERAVAYELPLIGPHQVVNFSTLAALMKILAQDGVVRNIDCLAGVKNTRWAGRLEIRDVPPCFIIDAAHNEHGILALIEALADFAPFAERVLLYGASKEKDYRLALPHLPRIAPEVHLVEGFHRAEKTDVLAAQLPKNCEPLKSFSSPAQAVEFFAENESYVDKFLIATGSIFMIGELLNRLDSSHASIGAN